MIKETEIARFPARIAVADTFRYGMLSAIAISSAFLTVFLLIHRYGPLGIEEYDYMFGTSLAGFGFYAVYKAFSLNATTNERNRLAYRHSIRNTVRLELTSFLRTEDVDRMVTGKAVQSNGYLIWLKRSGRDVALMTNKQMGVRQRQFAV